jgi:hypothetical protein
MVTWMSEHPGSTVNDIAAHFHRTRRQVRRDVEYLASVGDSLPGASFEVDWELYEREQRVTLRSTLGASAPLRLSALEAQALLIGLSAITPLLGSDLAAHVPHAALVVCALGGLKEADGEQYVEAIASPASSSASLEALRDALMREERVSFTYVSASGIQTRRVVDPWSLEATATGWLLRGWCTRAGQARSFAVASISDVRGEGRRVEEPRRVRQDAPTWMLEVDRDARWIADEYDGHIAAELADGGARVILPVWNDQWGLSLLIDIAPHLRTVSPDMRRAAARHARTILAKWNREDAS